MSGEAVVNAVKNILLQTKQIKAMLSEAPALRDLPLFAEECKKTGAASILSNAASSPWVVQCF